MGGLTEAFIVLIMKTSRDSGNARGILWQFQLIYQTAKVGAAGIKFCCGCGKNSEQQEFIRVTCIQLLFFSSSVLNRVVRQRPCELSYSNKDKLYKLSR